PYGTSADPRVVSITVGPQHRVLSRQARQQLVVTAKLSDGSLEDVTRRAEYKSNLEELLSVTANGVVTATDTAGEGAIVISYLGQLATFRGTVQSGMTVDSHFAGLQPSNYVDEHVFAKLKQLGIPPSALCSDSEFIRRVSIDLTGTLPTPAEVEKF